MRRVALTLLALIVACGDNLVDPATPQSGSRLKLAWYAYEGGARELERSWYYDTQLEQRCTGQTWSDGRRYCGPATDEAVFVNDTCTRALGRTLVGLPPGPFFATTFKLATEPLPVRSRLFRRGEPAAAPITVFQKGTAGCIPIEVLEDFDYFELGEEIQLSALVHLRRGEPVGTGALAVIHELGDDGLRVPVSLYARDADSECAAIDRANAATVECTPLSAPVAAYFHDAACTEPAVASEAMPTRAVRFETATSCWHYYRVGSEVSVPPLYDDTGAGCMQTAPPAGKRFYVMADEQAMPSLMRNAEGAARARAVFRTHDELRVLDPFMYDAELDTDCQHDDSMLACVPRTEAVVQSALFYFADPLCETPVRLAFVPSGACDPPARFAVDRDQIYPLAAPYTNPIYVPSTGDTCSGFAPPVPFTAWTVGPPLDPASFMRAKLAIDP